MARALYRDCKQALFLRLLLREFKSALEDMTTGKAPGIVPLSTIIKLPKKAAVELQSHPRPKSLVDVVVHILVIFPKGP